MTDRELDALVAEKVMGMWREPWNDESAHWWQKHSDGTSKMHANVNLLGSWTSHFNALPKFSTTLDAAWLVVEEMRRRGWDFILEVVHDKSRIHPKAGIFDAQFSSRDGEGQAYTDDTPSRAICLAALKALQVEIER